MLTGLVEEFIFGDNLSGVLVSEVPRFFLVEASKRIRSSTLKTNRQQVTKEP